MLRWNRSEHFTHNYLSKHESLQVKRLGKHCSPEKHTVTSCVVGQPVMTERKPSVQICIVYRITEMLFQHVK